MIFGHEIATISENNEKVHDAGVEAGIKAEYDRFWDSYQQNGDRVIYSRAFTTCWNDELFYPKYDMYPTKADFMFNGVTITNLKERLKECNRIIDFSNVTAFQQIFQDTNTYALPVIDMSNATSSSYAFYSSYIVEIEKIISSENTTFSAYTFGIMSKLENVVFEGTIAKNGLDIHWSKKLTHDSLMSIINCLKDYSEDTSGTSWAVTLGTDNLVSTKLTDEEKAIATEKGWTLA